MNTPTPVNIGLQTSDWDFTHLGHDKMVAIAPHENHAAPPDEVSDAIAALDELKAEFGIKIILAAILRSDLADSLPSHAGQTRRVIQFVLREIVFAADPQLEAEIMAIGSGVLDEKGIMTRIAEKRGITRAAISKRVVAFCEEFNLPPSGAMKSEAAKGTYAARNQPRFS